MYPNQWSDRILSFAWFFVQYCGLYVLKKSVKPSREDLLDNLLIVLLYVFANVVFTSVIGHMLSFNAAAEVWTIGKLYSTNECNEIIRCAEGQAMHNEFGWEKHRHKNYPTTDLAVYTFNESFILSDSSAVDCQLWINKTIDSRVFPHMAKLYSLDTTMFTLKDLFVVKYDSSVGSQSSLALHQDSSMLTFSLALSKSSSESFGASFNRRNMSVYTGGGTFYRMCNCTTSAFQGDLVIQPSRIEHGGTAITEGTRYILVGFVNVEWFWPATFWRNWGGFARCLEFLKFSNLNEREEMRTGRYCSSWGFNYLDWIRLTVSRIATDCRDSDGGLNHFGIVCSLLVLLLTCLCVGLFISCLFFLELNFKSNNKDL